MNNKAGLSFSNVEVGDQVYISFWTDKNPGTVVEVKNNGREIVVQRDEYKYDESKGEAGKGMGHQNWICVRDTNGHKDTFTWRTSKGRNVGYVKKGEPLSRPFRSQVGLGWSVYYDWSF
jgi:hypothetical protein